MAEDWWLCSAAAGNAAAESQRERDEVNLTWCII